ncbi:MAG: hypothetical protein FJY85_10760 [Deltaproteobacteria bacterium]|nr:hypothetical protein [Deltaproteobacteria bacterium]
MFIEETDLFRDVPQETMQEISKLMVKESYAKGAVIYTQDDPAKDF